MDGLVTVAAALIVKNEERVLARCLDGLLGAVDEIVVVDTGSDDGTKEVAARYTDQVFDFAWRDDFAAARQFAFDQTTADWVIWLDADDVLLGAEAIRPLVAAAPADVGGFFWRYVLGRDGEGRPTFAFWRERCVRTDGGFRWHGRVHEVLVSDRPWLLPRNDDVVVEHHPPPAQGAAKVGRNLRILEAEYAEHGGALEPRRLFYLAREHADAGDADRAIAVFEEYLAVGVWDDERYLAQTGIADLHRQQRRYDAAIDADLGALKIHPRWPDAYFGLAESYYYLADWPKVVHWTEVARELPVPDTLLFVNPRDYSYNWIIYYTNALYRVGDLAAALAFTRLERVMNSANDDTSYRPMRRRTLCPSA